MGDFDISIIRLINNVIKPLEKEVLIIMIYLITMILIIKQTNFQNQKKYILYELQNIQLY